MEERNTSFQILKRLVEFSIPLILSGLLQQLFNWVDALIVGNIINETALAGVGATTSIYNLLINVIVGFSSGLSVLTAQQLGQGKCERITDLLAAYSVLLGLIFAVGAVLGTVFVNPVLKLMNTPTRLLDYAGDYLVIIFSGIPFLAVYNTYSAVLRGIGDSKLPFIAVLISSIINVVLDYVFVSGCGYGVSGAAIATVISQAAMTVFIVVYAAFKYPELRFLPFKTGRDRKAIATGIKYGAPPAVQSGVSSMGNLLLQKFMNGFGEQTVGAITTAYRVDSVLFLPIINFSTAISTLTAHEIGAENYGNAKRIFRLGTVLMISISLLLTVVILLIGDNLLAIFGLTDESIMIGKSFFKSIAVFYAVYGLSMSIKGYLEGNSDMLFTGVTGICSLGVRILCSYLLASVFGNMVIAYAEAFSWIFLLVVFALRYKRKHCMN